jgi:hypothetical protein
MRMYRPTRPEQSRLRKPALAAATLVATVERDVHAMRTIDGARPSAPGSYARGRDPKRVIGAAIAASALHGTACGMNRSGA